jgi:hypothetical protein
VITFSEGKRPESALAFAPRPARKGKALGKGRQAPSSDKTLAPLAQAGERGQDDFRAIVMAKNNQRKDNLDAQMEGTKRPADSPDEPDAKRFKQ